IDNPLTNTDPTGHFPAGLSQAWDLSNFYALSVAAPMAKMQLPKWNGRTGGFEGSVVFFVGGDAPFQTLTQLDTVSRHRRTREAWRQYQAHIRSMADPLVVFHAGEIRMAEINARPKTMVPIIDLDPDQHAVIKDVDSSLVQDALMPVMYSLLSCRTAYN